MLIPVDKIVGIIRCYGPQTYEDMVIQGFNEEEHKLNRLVQKGILEKNGKHYSLRINKNFDF